MNSRTAGGGEASVLSPVFSAVADERRRHVLATLHGWSGPGAISGLARTVAARENGCDRSDVPDADVQSVHESLHHVHLPKLAAAGLVERDGETVSLRGDPVAVRTAEGIAVLGEDPSLDGPFRAIADARRRRILTTLRTADRPMSIDELVADVRERTPSVESSPTGDVETVLVHADLPTLEEANLVTRGNDGRVVYTGLPQACRWLAATILGARTVGDDEDGEVLVDRSSVTDDVLLRPDS